MTTKIMMEKLVSGAGKLGISFTPKQLEQFYSYYQELLDWNQRVNLTSVTDFKKVQIKHFLDSLTVTLAGQRLRDTGIIDVGTGAGLPGMPLKILFPSIRLVLLEATAKKTNFLLHLKERLDLADVEVIVGRAEEVAHQGRYREGFDIVLSRAVAPLATLVELTLPFLKIGGHFVAQKKGVIEAEINKAAGAISLLGGRLLEIKRIELDEFTDGRCLVIIEKISPTPEKYPRRSGMPAKRPIRSQ